jgi:hypothetical protein
VLCVSTHWQSDGTSVSVLVEDMSRNKCFFRFEYHVFYVLYQFVTYLLTLRRMFRKIKGCAEFFCGHDSGDVYVQHSHPLREKCLIKHRAMKTYGKWRYRLRVLNLFTRWRWMASFSSRCLYPRICFRAGLDILRTRRMPYFCRELNLVVQLVAL